MVPGEDVEGKPEESEDPGNDEKPEPKIFRKSQIANSKSQIANRKIVLLMLQALFTRSILSAILICLVAQSDFLKRIKIQNVRALL